MLIVLFGALHEDEGSVGGHLVFALFSNEPTLFGGVGDGAVVSRDSLKFNLNFTLH